MTGVKTVPITMPTMVWGRLATLADTRQTTIAVLVAEAIGKLVPEPPPAPPLDVLRAELVTARAEGFRAPRRDKRRVVSGKEGQILVLTDEGLSAVQIGRKIGVDPRTVTRVRDHAREDRVWEAEQRRQYNLASFRHTKEEKR